MFVVNKMIFKKKKWLRLINVNELFNHHVNKFI
jgi:hypothetical protein